MVQAMPTLVQNQELERMIIEDRRRRGVDGPDEVWDGVYLIMPNPNDEHQQLSMYLLMWLCQLIEMKGLGQVRPGVNVSDRILEWEHNYRCPDVAVFLNDSSAECHDTFWYGGPDFAIEIVSPNDRTRDKLEFYASVNTRELLVIDRDPWSLELYRLHEGEMQLTGRCTPDAPEPLASEVLPLTWNLTAPADAQGRPRIQLRHADGRNWVI
jgi:Uma2 family endonuclease